jgi:DNA-directed RNA polymerase subunit RPC12/RpoP
MLTRTCSNCGRRNTAMKPLKVQAQETNKKCKYCSIGTLGPALETNPYNPLTPVPGLATN